MQGFEPSPRAFMMDFRVSYGWNARNIENDIQLSKGPYPISRFFRVNLSQETPLSPCQKTRLVRNTSRCTHHRTSKHIDRHTRSRRQALVVDFLFVIMRHRVLIFCCRILHRRNGADVERRLSGLLRVRMATLNGRARWQKRYYNV